MIDGGNVLDEVDYPAGITEFVIVPGDEFDECWAELDAGGGIKDGRVSVSNEIGGDDLLFGVA